MSSSPPTEARRRVRWRDPAGWPLRTRLVALMIVLLSMLGILVAGTTEVFLSKSLYDQLDSKLRDTQLRSIPYLEHINDGSGQRFPGGGGGGQGPSLQPKTIVIRLSSSGAKGGIVRETGSSFDQRVDPLSSAAMAQVEKLTPNGHATTVDVSGLGTYRMAARLDPPDPNDPQAEQTVTIVGLPAAPTQQTLLWVALVTGGALLIALGIAGWAGAVIIRRNLLPLDRVAATATKVSELRLDRGEVRLAQRVPVGDTDPRTEVGQVGAALNRMLDHVGNALEARHASEMQVRQFVADASHELRTPLAAIRGYAELSRRSRAPVSEEIAHVLGRVESEAKRMTGLVEDLLLLARLDAGRPLAHDPVDLTMLVVDAVSDSHAAGPRHNWQLDLPEEPVTVIGDQQRLHQVLANLLANARTHTPEGTTVTVAVSATHDAAVIRVIDFGPGIPAELQPHIFERFARGDSSRSRAAGSTGLGLSIVAAVVAAHRGHVSVQSRPGQTVFTVVLPLVPAPVGEQQQYARTLPRAR
jgi:two-component system, OmpR family, sensor kinase